MYKHITYVAHILRCTALVTSDSGIFITTHITNLHNSDIIILGWLYRRNCTCQTHRIYRHCRVHPLPLETTGPKMSPSSPLEAPSIFASWLHAALRLEKSQCCVVSHQTSPGLKMFVYNIPDPD